MFTEDDVQNAPRGHVRFYKTGVEVITNRFEGSNDLNLIVKVNGVAVYRATLQGAFRRGLEPDARKAERTPQDIFMVRTVE